ncbi:hypothetical protein EYR41_005406 [Orbilia oligospora]|uniref:NADP-dependent oxidoreductase domain-containing protein n=1 Tax=Orbilia oligospora TaxID=2813651 RepID=A0A8H2E008_ORBOL|nr:hypothetical protein EYR41_005406 [Orbilia oligospora]
MASESTPQSIPLPLAPPLSIPVLGLGVFQSTKTHSSVLSALSSGYRHLDTAQIYYNEAATGAAVTEFLAKTPSVSRSDIFICSKLWEVDLTLPGFTSYTKEGAIDGFNRSLAAMGPGIDYIDLYLIHNPRPGPTARLQAWLGLQEIVKSGKAKSIGVSNWSKHHIEELIANKEVDITPAVNQIEFHPWCQHKALVEYCQQKGIVVVAYSPLTQGTRLKDPVILDIAGKYGKTAAQVVLRWCLQRGVVIIPKSDKEERIKENSQLWGWELAEEDMDRITALDEGISGKLGEWDPDAWE